MCTWTTSFRRNRELEKADIGLIGLAVMGENLALNIESKGYQVAVFNRTVSKVDNFINSRARGKQVVGTYSVEELIQAVATPRKIILMVKAGEPVDQFIEMLRPLLSDGDLIIDGGNANFADTMRRHDALTASGLLFIGTGISGGEEGALKGAGDDAGRVKESIYLGGTDFHENRCSS